MLRTQTENMDSNRAKLSLLCSLKCTSCIRISTYICVGANAWTLAFYTQSAHIYHVTKFKTKKPVYPHVYYCMGGGGTSMKRARKVRNDWPGLAKERQRASERETGRQIEREKCTEIFMQVTSMWKFSLGEITEHRWNANKQSKAKQSKAKKWKAYHQRLLSSVL